MSMTEDLRDLLKGAQIASGRVYRDERPQTSGLPAVRMQVISDERPVTYEGRQTGRPTRVQFDCMGTERSQADQVAEAVIAAVEPRQIFNATKFVGAFVDGSRTYSDRAADGPVTYVTSLDMIVWHQPAA